MKSLNVPIHNRVLDQIDFRDLFLRTEGNEDSNIVRVDVIVSDMVVRLVDVHAHELNDSLLDGRCVASVATTMGDSSRLREWMLVNDGWADATRSLRESVEEQMGRTAMELFCGNTVDIFS